MSSSAGPCSSLWTHPISWPNRPNPAHQLPPTLTYPTSRPNPTHLFMGTGTQFIDWVCSLIRSHQPTLFFIIVRDIWHLDLRSATYSLHWKKVGRPTVRSLNAPKWCIITRSGSVLRTSKGLERNWWSESLAARSWMHSRAGRGRNFRLPFCLIRLFDFFSFVSFLCFSWFLFDCFPPEMSRRSTCSEPRLSRAE